MGRKQNPSQRTKGNLKPSSSAKAAELLEASGNAGGGFLGFGLLGSSAQESEEMDSSIDSDFAMVMKRMTKKDTTTKLKAAQEFSKLCKEKELDAVGSALPYWPKIFSRLTADCDSRVREASNEALEQLVIRVRRNLAPHLKLLMGPWMVAQCDVYAPAASAAKSAFSSAFAADKKAEAVGFCKSEILLHIEDVLMKQSQPDPKMQAEEQDEIASRQVQMLSSALESLGLFCGLLQGKQLELMHDGFSQILKNSKFWKFGKHPSCLVRSGFFRAVASFAEFCPKLAVQFSSQICPAVLYVLDESDPTVAPVLWMAVLHVITVIPDWSSKINPKKGMYPKLWAFLKSGGYGSATLTYPNLLPFLSLLPFENPADRLWFIDRFFSEMKMGLTAQHVKQSTAELNAVIKAFMECVQFCVKQAFASSSFDRKLIECLTMEQVIPLVNAAIGEGGSGLSRSRLFKDVAVLLASIQRISDPNGEHDCNTDTSAHAESIFNEIMEDLSRTILKNIEEGNVLSLSCVADFLGALSPQTEEVKELKRAKKLVKFFDVEHGNGEEEYTCEDMDSHMREASETSCKQTDQKTVTSASDVDKSNTKDVLKYEMLDKAAAAVKEGDIKDFVNTKNEISDKENSCESELDVSQKQLALKPTQKLLDLVNAVCLRSIKLAKEQKETGYVALFSKTFKAFASAELVHFLIDNNPRPENRISFSDDHLTLFITDFLMPWIIENQSTECLRSTETMDYLLDVVTVVWNMLDGKSKVGILSRLIENPPGCGRLLQHLVLSSRDKAVDQWLLGAEFGDFIVSVGRDLCRKSSEYDGREVVSSQNEKWSLMCFALSAGRNGEPKVGEQYLSLLLGIVHSYLPSQLKADDESVGQCVSFVCDITFHFLMNLSDSLSVPSYEGLLLSIFQLSLQPSFLSEEVLEKVHSTWKHGFTIVLGRTGSDFAGESFIGKVTSCLEDSVYNKAETVLRLQQLANVAFQVLKVILKVHGENEKMAESFVKQLCCKFSDSEMTFWKGALIADREVPFDLQDLSGCASGSPDVVPKCVTSVAFTSMFLVKILSLYESPVCEKIALKCKDNNETQVPDPPSESMTCDSDITPADVKVQTVEKLLSIDAGIYVDIALGLAFCHAVLKNQSALKQSSELVILESELEKNLNFLTHGLSSNVLGIVVIDAFERSLEKGRIWSRGLLVLLQRAVELQFGGNHVDCVGGLDRFLPETASTVDTLRVAMPFFEVEHVLQLADFSLAQLISFPSEVPITEFLESITLALTVINTALSLHDHHSSAKADAFSNLLSATLQQVNDWRNNHRSIFLFDSRFSTENWKVVAFNLEVMRLFTLAVSKFPTSLDSSYWDTVLCSAVSWIQSIAEVQTGLTCDLLALTFACGTCDLLQAIDVCMEFVFPEQSSSFPPDILSEWKDVFSGAAYDVLLPVFMDVSEKASTTQVITQEFATMLYRLSSAVVHCSSEILLQHKLKPKLVPDVDTNLPDNLQTLLNYCCPLLLSCHYHLQLAAYRLLLKVIPDLPKYSEKSSGVDGNDEAEHGQCPLQSLINVIEVANLNIRTFLDDVMFGETVIVEPFTSVFTSVMAYMLGWNVLLHFFKMSSSERRVQYAQWISEQGIMDQLLQNMFRFMPQNPVIVLKDALVVNGASKKLANSRNMFAEDPSSETRPMTGRHAVTHVQHLACTVYRRTLETLPAIVRQWWTEQDKRVAGIVERFTARHVSPLLCARELQTIQETSGGFANMTIKVRPLTREVIANYVLEECNMELIITLPANLPFGTVSVESGNRVGVTKPQWRTWVLHLFVFLSFQNGSILDALSLWKQNVDKQFEGLEDCMICFSVIHGSNNKLPKCQCKTCKKRFHSSCLFKWFKSSANSACPLCRNLF